jgi:hypothetical protein
MATIRELMNRGKPPVTNRDLAEAFGRLSGKRVSDAAVSLMVHGHRKWKPSYIPILHKMLEARKVSITLKTIVRLCGLNDTIVKGD